MFDTWWVTGLAFRPKEPKTSSFSSFEFSFVFTFTRMARQRQSQAFSSRERAAWHVEKYLSNQKMRDAVTTNHWLSFLVAVVIWSLESKLFLRIGSIPWTHIYGCVFLDIPIHCFSSVHCSFIQCQGVVGKVWWPFTCFLKDQPHVFLGWMGDLSSYHFRFNHRWLEHIRSGFWTSELEVQCSSRPPLDIPFIMTRVV